MSELQKAITSLEGTIAQYKAKVDAIDKAIAPVDAEIDAILEEENLLKARLAAATAKLTAARGMPPEEYVAFKKKYGMLCATRMSMIAAQKALK
jgi:chromosome segregation ATPase